MSDRLLPLLFPGIVLLLAAAAYALLFFTSRAEDVPAAVCTAALWQDTLSLKGVVSRGETPEIGRASCRERV